jgi:hypothetical protein
MANCAFSGRCINESNECDFCQYNPESCTQDFFEWNGEDEEPTQAGLDKEIQN